MKITINKKSYPVKFGYGALKLILKEYKYKKLSDLDKVFKKLNFKEGQEPTFEQMDAVAIIIACGIENACKTKVNPDDIGDLFLKEPDVITGVMNEFTASLPQEDSVGK